MRTHYSDTQQEVNQYFESSSDYWGSIYSDHSLQPTIYQDRLNTSLRWIAELGLRQDARILEVGCGAGLLTLDLAQRGHLVDALDSTTAMVHMARTNAIRRGLQNRIRFQLGDVHALQFETHAFDLAIAIGVVPWLHSESVALSEINRVLRPGGYLLVTADNNARLNRLMDPWTSPLLTPLRKAAKRCLQACRCWPPQLNFQPKRHYPHEFHGLLEKCHFKTVKSLTIGFGPFTLFGKELFTDQTSVWFHRRLQTLSAARRLSPLCWTGSHHLVLATRL